MGARRRGRSGIVPAPAPVAPTGGAAALLPDTPESEPSALDPPNPLVDIKEVEALAGTLNKSAERLQTHRMHMW